MSGSVQPAAEDPAAGKPPRMEHLVQKCEAFCQPTRAATGRKPQLPQGKVDILELQQKKRHQEEKGDVISGNVWDVEVRLRDLGFFSLQRGRPYCSLELSERRL